MFVITKQIVTDVAKTIRREAAARGIAVVGHSRSLDGTARALGFRDFNGLSAAIEMAPLHLEVKGDDDRGSQFFRMMSSYSEDWSFRVVGAPSGSGKVAPRRYRTALEMGVLWRGAAADDWRRMNGFTATTLALIVIVALGRSWMANGLVPGGVSPSTALRVPATIRTDDGLREADFDATAYFEQAPDQELRDLHSIGFRGDYPADAVARHFEDESGFEHVTAVLEYDQKIARCGFEVVVDPEAAAAWIAARRPALSASLMAGDAAEGPTGR